MSEAFEQVPGLVIFEGGFPEPDAADEEYEQNLRTCRRFGHRVFSFFVDGLEVLVCSRCESKFREVVG